MGYHLTSSVLSSRDASEAVDLELAAACLLLSLIDASCNAALSQYRCCCDDRNILETKLRSRRGHCGSPFRPTMRNGALPKQPSGDETCPDSLLFVGTKLPVVYEAGL